jgi:hypothetical protein
VTRVTRYRLPRSSSLFLRGFMGKGKPISEDLRWAIVRMHTLGVSIGRISAYTDVSKRQIYRLINRFLTTGKVLTATQRRKTGRTRHLTTEDVAVCPSYPCILHFLRLPVLARFLGAKLRSLFGRTAAWARRNLWEGCFTFHDMACTETKWLYDGEGTRYHSFTPLRDNVSSLPVSQSNEVLPSAQNSNSKWVCIIDHISWSSSMKARATAGHRIVERHGRLEDNVPYARHSSFGESGA